MTFKWETRHCIEPASKRKKPRKKSCRSIGERAEQVFEDSAEEENHGEVFDCPNESLDPAQETEEEEAEEVVEEVEAALSLHTNSIALSNAPANSVIDHKSVRSQQTSEENTNIRKRRMRSSSTRGKVAKRAKTVEPVSMSVSKVSALKSNPTRQKALPPPLVPPPMVSPDAAFEVGQLVWGRSTGYKYWPAVITEIKPTSIDLNYLGPKGSYDIIPVTSVRHWDHPDWDCMVKAGKASPGTLANEFIEALASAAADY